MHVAWFPYMNPHTVILTMVGRDDLILLVVPCGQPGSRRRSTLARRPFWQPAAIAADGDDGMAAVTAAG